MELQSMNSAELFDLAQTVTPGGVNSVMRKPLTPVVIEKGRGAHLWDVEGRRYVDYVCNMGAGLLGHCHRELNEATFDALGTLDQAGIGLSLYEIELALKLKQHVPSCDLSVVLVTGTEASYHAVRLSRAVTGRTDVIRMDGSYHGWHDYIIAASPGWRGSFFGGVLEDAIKHTHTVPYNDLDALDLTVKKSGNQIAAIFVETLMLNAGYIPPEPGYYEGLREYCSDNGIILVFDEIITGFRCHLGGYQAICGVTPDLTLIGKAMANGYPIAAICGRDEYMSRFNTAPGGDVSIGGTYNGYAGACAAARKTIELLEDGMIYEHINALGERLRNGINDIASRLEIGAFATGYGSTWILYFQKDRAVRRFQDITGPDYNEAAELEFRRAMIEKGVWVFPWPRKRGYISASHTVEDIDATLERVDQTLTDMKRRGVV